MSDVFWLVDLCDSSSCKLSSGHMRCFLCFPEWVAYKYINNRMIFQGHGSPLISVSKNNRTVDNNHWDFKSPYISYFAPAPHDKVERCHTRCTSCPHIHVEHLYPPLTLSFDQCIFASLHAWHGWARLYPQNASCDRGGTLFLAIVVFCTDSASRRRSNLSILSAPKSHLVSMFRKYI